MKSAIKKLKLPTLKQQKLPTIKLGKPRFPSVGFGRVGRPRKQF